MPRYQARPLASTNPIPSEHSENSVTPSQWPTMNSQRRIGRASTVEIVFLVSSLPTDAALRKIAAASASRAHASSAAEMALARMKAVNCGF